MSEKHSAEVEALARAVAQEIRSTYGVSFVEIADKFPEHFGGEHRFYMELPDKRNVILWCDMSEDMCDALGHALDKGWIRVKATSVFVYLADGWVLNIPTVGKRIPRNGYKSRRWLPVTFDRGPQ